MSVPPAVPPTRCSSPQRTVPTILVILVAAVALVSCAGGSSNDGESSATTETVETTSSSTTTSSTTTTSTTTTTTWPRTPAAPVPASGAIPVVSRITTTDPVVFLTIDDGMVRDPRVAELLSSRRIPAALFLTEGNYLADPAYFALAASGGGSINSHTRTHTQLTRLSESAQRNEICGMRATIGQHILAPGHLFRAPYGVSNAATQRAAASCGINAILLWHAAINDGRVQYQQGTMLQPGDIVLSHFRVDLYEGILAFLAEAERAGLHVVPIENYLPLPAGT